MAKRAAEMPEVPPTGRGRCEPAPVDPMAGKRFDGRDLSTDEWISYGGPCHCGVAETIRHTHMSKEQAQLEELQAKVDTLLAERNEAIGRAAEAEGDLRLLRHTLGAQEEESTIDFAYRIKVEFKIEPSFSKYEDVLRKHLVELAERESLPVPDPDQGRSFSLTPEQVESYEKWDKEHKIAKHGGPKEPYSGAIGGRITFCFTSTGLGEIQSVECGLCNESHNLTDFDQW